MAHFKRYHHKVQNENNDNPKSERNNEHVHSKWPRFNEDTLSMGNTVRSVGRSSIRQQCVMWIACVYSADGPNHFPTPIIHNFISKQLTYKKFNQIIIDGSISSS